MVGIGSYLVAFGALAIALTPLPIAAVPLLLGLGFLSGLILVPAEWRPYSRRPELKNEAIEADGDGISIRTGTIETRHAWSVFRRARESWRAFVLVPAGPVAELISKRAVPLTDVDAFRALLVEAGLLRPPTRADRLRPWLGFVIGLSVFIGQLILIGVFA